jgi:type II secretory pathway pseudopilin PulG
MDLDKLPKLEEGTEMTSIVLLLAAILGHQCRGSNQTARLQQAISDMQVGLNALQVAYNAAQEEETP